MKGDQRFSLGWYAFIIGIATILAVCTVFGNAAAKSKSGGDTDPYLEPIELLGKYVFFDKISSPKRMACVTCHDPATGGTGSVSGVNLHQVAITGANPHTIGNIKPPTNAYASLIDPFQPCGAGGLGPLNMCGGNFWNGRAEGNLTAEFPDGATKHIGEEVFYDNGGGRLADVERYDIYFGGTADQALNPMPNIVEQNIDRLAVCNHVESSKYASLYEEVWGVPIDCSDEIPVVEHASDVDEEYPFDISFKRLMLAICAWQSSPDLNSFSCKRDIALQQELDCLSGSPNAIPEICAHENYINSPGEFPLVGLTDQENLGHDLFYNTAPPFVPALPPFPELPVTNCSFCHSDNPGDTGNELDQLYADDAYHNIGTPPNPEIPLTYNSEGEPIDPDLGIASHAFVDNNSNGENDYPPGFFKTPTLRNVDKRKGEGFIKAYTHNGWFKSLESIVHFYNTAAMQEDLDNLPPFIPPSSPLRVKQHDVTRCPPEITTEKEALANNCWPEPAYSGAAFGLLLGNIGLTPDQEAAIVAYLKTLTDEHTAKAPKPYKPTARWHRHFRK